MGVGGEDSWGAQPLKKYQIPAKDYEFYFKLIPIKMENDPFVVHKNHF